MKKYIWGIVVLIIVSFIVGCFYLVFNRSENLTITYIKFKVNPEFVIGINSHERVVVYNPLNEEAKIFDLMMFNNKTLEEVCEIIINKMTANGYLIDNTINVTIMTKNLEKRNQFVKQIKSSIDNVKENVVINTLTPTNDELFTYSNEVTYDLKVTYNENELISIATSVEEKIDLYVNDKLKALNLNNFTGKEQMNVINDNSVNGYFNDFDFSNILVGDNIFISPYSNYEIEFVFNDDFTYSYNIIISLIFDYYKEIVVEDTSKGIVEVYEYTYNQLGNSLISDYKNYFYQFNY